MCWPPEKCTPPLPLTTILPSAGCPLLPPARAERGPKQVGPVNTLHTRQVGGLPADLPITLQAVRKNWPASGTYLIIHAQAWPCGR